MASSVSRPLLLTDVPNDCLAHVVKYVPPNHWPCVRAACRDLRDAVRDATTGLMLDLVGGGFGGVRGGPFLPSDDSPSSFSRVREVRLLAHRARDDESWVPPSFGELGPALGAAVELLEAVERARSSSESKDVDVDDGATAASTAPSRLVRVSLSVRNTRASTPLRSLLRLLRDAGISGRINGVLYLRLDGAEEEPETRVDGGPPDGDLWPAFPRECRVRADVKLVGSHGRRLLREIAAAPVVSLVVNQLTCDSSSLSVGARSESLLSELRTMGASVARMRGTLEELSLCKGVPPELVASIFRGGDGGDGDGVGGGGVSNGRVLQEDEEGEEERQLERMRWPVLRKVALLGEPSSHRERDGAFFPSLSLSFEGGGGERRRRRSSSSLVFPRLETLSVTRGHSEGWLRRFKGVVDPERVTVELL